MLCLIILGKVRLGLPRLVLLSKLGFKLLLTLQRVGLQIFFSFVGEFVLFIRTFTSKLKLT
jgi:hypothetical protein